MSDGRFSHGHYEDALQYAKEILSNSSSIDEIITNGNIIKASNEEEEMKERKNQNK